jgi:hypothetical protein
LGRLLDRLGQRLDRAVRLSTEEHRRERVRRKALEAKMDALAEAQAKTEHTLDRFIDSMKRGGNGHEKA